MSLVCPNGHHWDMSVEESALTVDATAACPVCGAVCTSAPGVAPLEATSLEVDATKVTLGLPPAAPTWPDIPGYVITELLGQGGMGSVYRARHLRLGRMVALKTIAGDHASGPRLARFQAEAQALARLHHPHVVQIYEVSESKGLPYFAMEFLEGGGLDRKLAGTPQPPKDAARTVEVLARAIHDAHEHGIVHRDLKPANVLLTHDGEPKISDFGLVKRLQDDTAQTRTGDILGTPLYMAPEQVAGSSSAIGPCTDIYALGAILYEMLTGRPPFRGTTTVETFELTRSAEPVSPRRLQPGVPRDLETICLKCLEKPPDKRYASARALADDLARFLVNRPIAARRAGLAYRLGKWARRRPAVAALVAVVLVAALGTAGLGIWYNAGLRSAAQRADERSRLARGVVDDMYTKVAEEWLIDEPFKDPLRQEFLEKAMHLYKEFVREEGNDPRVVRESALAHFRLGQIHRILNRHAAAQEEYRQAIVLQKSLYDRFRDDPQYRQDLANSHNWLGELLRESGGALTQAEAHYNTAREFQEGLMAEFPGDPVYRQEAARSHYNLGIVYIDLPREKLAREHLKEALDLLTTLHQDFPDVRSYHHELARCLINHGVLFKNSDPEQARDDYKRAIDHLTKLQAAARFRAVYRSDLASVRQNLGNLLDKEGQSAGALRELEQAQELLADLAHDFPTRPGYKEKLANCCNSLASVRAGATDFTEAQKNWGRAKALLEQLVSDYPTVPDYHYRLGITLGNLGWLRSKKEDLPAARQHLEKAIEHLRSALASNANNPEYLQALRNQYQSLAETSVQLGDHAAAARAAAALAEVFKDRPQDLYYAACFLARCAPLAAQDQKLPDTAARDLCAKEYVHQSLLMLRKAAHERAGVVQRLSNEKEVFQPLLQDPEAAELLAQLSSNPSRK
jgi:tetratricopeptide (TPR) repeat protein